MDAGWRYLSTQWTSPQAALSRTPRRRRCPASWPQPAPLCRPASGRGGSCCRPGPILVWRVSQPTLHPGSPHLRPRLAPSGWKRNRISILHQIELQDRVLDFCSWKDSGFIVAEDLIRRGGAFHCGAFHKALEIDGAVFAGEVAVAGPFTLDTSKRRVLAFFPIGVGAQQIGTAEWRVESRPAVPELRDAGE